MTACFLDFEEKSNIMKDNQQQRQEAENTRRVINEDHRTEWMKYKGPLWSLNNLFRSKQEEGRKPLKYSVPETELETVKQWMKNESEDEYVWFCMGARKSESTPQSNILVPYLSYGPTEPISSEGKKGIELKVTAVNNEKGVSTIEDDLNVDKVNFTGSIIIDSYTAKKEAREWIETDIDYNLFKVREDFANALVRNYQFDTYQNLVEYYGGDKEKAKNIIDAIDEISYIFGVATPEDRVGDKYDGWPPFTIVLKITSTYSGGQNSVTVLENVATPCPPLCNDQQ